MNDTISGSLEVVTAGLVRFIPHMGVAAVVRRTSADGAVTNSFSPNLSSRAEARPPSWHLMLQDEVRIMKKAVFAWAVAGCSFALPTLAQASPIDIGGPYLFLDNRQANDAGISAGVIIQLGATQVMPLGTTGYATYESNTIPLASKQYTIDPYFFAGGYKPPPAAISASGNYAAPSWTLHFENGGNTATATTPGISFAQNVSPIPFVSNVVISWSGDKPTLSWTNTGAGLDAVGIRIRENGTDVGGGLANIVFQTYLAPVQGTQSISPSSLSQLPLVQGKQYSIEIAQIQTRNDVAPVSGQLPFPSILNQSRSFVDFTFAKLESVPDNTPVYLPNVTLSSNNVPIYNFELSVLAGQTYFIDPTYASGYIFNTGLSDPLFASVILPVLDGTPSYTIVLPDGTTYTVVGGNIFDFTTHGYNQGVSAFRVEGITALTNLDPTDPMAFAAGLTFMGNGEFTGSMTPIVTDVPEPSTWAMMMLGFGGLGWLAYRRRSYAPALVAA